MQDTSKVVKEKLTLDSKLQFKCHPGIACFTRCCSNIDILLTPYDVVRMKNRLGISSTEFLKRHTRSEVDTKTGQPLIFIRMNDDEERYCPFVIPEKGCIIYTDRPAACRYYPVGQATHRRMDDKNERPIHDEFYVVVKEDHCLGFKEDKVWTIKEWRIDQEAALYDNVNREWKNLMMKRLLPGEGIDEKRQAQFYIASYDIDRFRRYVFESRFLEIFDIDAKTLAKIKTDEVELLQFAFKYLKYIFGIKQELQVKKHITTTVKNKKAKRKRADQV